MTVLDAQLSAAVMAKMLDEGYLDGFPPGVQDRFKGKSILMLTGHILACARVCHEANRALQVTLGEAASPPWDDAEDWMKETTCNGILFKIRNPLSSPSALHENWMIEKLASGWRYGEVKDVAKKEHPCLITYDKLPLGQRQKDELFNAIVRALLLRPLTSVPEPTDEV